MSNLVCMGVIFATHGVKGRVKVKTFTENPLDLTAYGDLCDEKGNVLKLKITSQQPDNVIAEIEGINSMEKAEELLGTELFINRSQMPETKDGIYYYSDLKGLEVRLQDGKKYGKVLGITSYGAGDIVEIELENGQEESHSFDHHTFPEVNIKEGFIVLNPQEAVEAK